MDAIVVDDKAFAPVRVTEERLEGLLRTAGSSVFPGFEYFEFKPAIRCGDRTRHPDGVLLSPESAQWWVVEVETHFHDPDAHIEAQLRDLAGGFYGPEAFAYLDRHPGFCADRYAIDLYEPSLLLVIDVLTPAVRHLAARMSVPVVECAVFRDATSNRFAIAVSGDRPRTDVDALAPGIELIAEERDGVAQLRPADGKTMPVLKARDVVIGAAAYTCFPTSDRTAIVAPLTVAELCAATQADGHRFKLITNTARLVPIRSSGTPRTAP